MRRALLLLLLCAPGTASSGLFGGGPPTRIPVPARDFSAVVEDTGGVRVELSRVSWDGEVVVFGTLGLAQVTVPFETIRELRIEDRGVDETRTAVVTTRDGGEVQVSVDHDAPLYGRAPFGNYKIEAQDIRSVRFGG